MPQYDPVNKETIPDVLCRDTDFGLWRLILNDDIKTELDELWI